VITKVDPNSDAADKGLEPGDVLVSIANHPVRSPQDVKASVAAAQAAHRDTVLVLVTGQGGQRFVAIKLGA
jgi:serine protease Do